MVVKGRCDEWMSGRESEVLACFGIVKSLVIYHLNQSLSFGDDHTCAFIRRIDRMEPLIMASSLMAAETQGP